MSALCGADLSAAAVVADLDNEDYCGADCGYHVGYYQRHIIEQYTLDNEQYRAGAEGEKGRHGNS